MGPFPAGPAPSINVPASRPAAGGSDGPDNPTAQKALEQAAMALEAALKAEKDPEDKATISKLLAQVHSIEAGRQKERDAAMGVSPATKFVRRSTQSQAGGGAY